MVKKITAISLVFLISLSMFVVTFAASTPTINVSSATAAPGDTVTLKVSFSDNPGINTFSLGFDYDTSRLSLVSVTLANGLPGQFTFTKKAVWLNSSNITTNGDYLVLTLKVLDAAAVGDAKVAVTYSTGDISNYDEEDVNFNLVDGKVTVKNNSAEAGIITVGTVSAAPGETVNMPVSITKNPGINTFSLGFDYDTSKLTLQNVTIAAALGGQFTYSKKAVWLNSSDSTYTGQILTLTFKVSDEASEGDIPVNVTYNSGDISNYDEEDINFDLVAGKVSVATDIPEDAAQLVIGDKTVAAGKMFSIPIEIKNNPGLAYLKIKVYYDSEKLELISTNNSGLINGSYIVSPTISTHPYVISWSNPSDTKADGIITTLNFKVLDDVAEGNCDFRVTFEEAYNSAYSDVELKVSRPAIYIKNFIAGDVNGDNVINGKDSILLGQYLADWDVEIDNSAADVNNDGVINGKDSILLGQYLADWDVVLG